jgi:hypothetical protein
MEGRQLEFRQRSKSSQCLLVGVSPALIIGILFSLLMALVVVMAAFGGHPVYARDFIGLMLLDWLVIPLGAALLGTPCRFALPQPKLGASKYP